MTCWLTVPMGCNVAFVNCPAAPITKEYPRCGQIGTPACSPGRYCRQVDGQCKPGLTGCVGVCVPYSPGTATPQSPNPGFLPTTFPPLTQPVPVQPQQPQQGPNWGTPQQQQPPQQPQSQPGVGGQLGKPPDKCPTDYECPDKLVCIADPRDTLVTTRGPSFMCVEGGADATCAGFQNKQCANGDICVADPRMECFGAGCTGICA
ncbi:Superoxide-generating NADPH oxidase heavy chain subunit A [Venturia nashicola]|uniref:Superoxide-generating NADPH oxidase heavy chain subunit A n=1 Tax=Venturia nashicola TaxID=86259 RepID=A0A4Z1PKK3_9PEZI|nr:Superoxide-generating NADPH oxidase heavy chain subunit A [Venturia nashicola]